MLADTDIFEEYSLPPLKNKNTLFLYSVDYFSGVVVADITYMRRSGHSVEGVGAAGSWMCLVSGVGEDMLAAYITACFSPSSCIPFCPDGVFPMPSHVFDRSGLVC